MCLGVGYLGFLVEVLIRKWEVVFFLLIFGYRLGVIESFFFFFGVR